MGTFAGNWLIVAGILLVLVGVMAKFGLLGWFGHLPGDIGFKGEHGAFYFQLTSMLLVSLLFNIVVFLFRKLLWQ
jgi:hypothetical protein